MDEGVLATSVKFVTNSLRMLEHMSPREKAKFDEIEFVFADTLNGRRKQERRSFMSDILEKLQDGSKPIGALLQIWDNPDGMVVKPFPDITTEEQELLHHALAAAQDEARREYDGHDK